MAISAQLTLNEILIVGVDADPSTAGVAAPIGSLALLDDKVNSNIWLKSGSGDTAWAIVPRSLNGTTYTAGSVLFADSSGFISQDNANFFWDFTNHRLGIGTTNPTANIGLGGDQTRTLGMNRGTVAATAGYSLTVNAGGATSGSTDKNGGDLVLSSGTGTGTGLSNILLKVPATGSTGTSDNAPTTIGTIYNLGMAVTGLVAATGRFYSGGASTAGGIYLLYGASGSVSNFSIISGTAGTSNLAITDLKAGAERIRITSTGSVGIGTTTPSYKLDVQGGDINASGSVRAAGVALTSDARFKKDIKQIDNALDKICNIRGVSYNWRVDAFPEKQFNDRKQIGLIAQEVEQQFPEVIDIDKDGYKSINYPALVAPIIEAIKLLKDQIEDVKNKQSKIKNSCSCAQVRKNQKQSKASKQ